MAFSEYINFGYALFEKKLMNTFFYFFRYRKDLNKAAIKRAAIIVRSQKPLPTRKGGNKTAAKKSD